jgi:hypothetical protein
MAQCELNSSINRQIGLALQDDCETPAIVNASDFKVRPQQSPEFNLEIDMIENNESKKSFTKTGNVAGIQRMGASFEGWLSGSGESNQVNEFDKPLRACGMGSVDNITISVDIASIPSGAEYKTFSTLTGATSTAEGLLMFVDKKNSLAVFEMKSGSFVSGENLSDGAGFTIDTTGSPVSDSANKNYYPKSDNWEWFTYRQEGDDYAWEGYSVAGDLEISTEAGQPVASNFTFAGKSALYKNSLITGLTGGSVAVGDTATDGSGNVVKVVSALTGSETYFNYEVVSGALPDATAITFSGGASATTASVQRDSIGDRVDTIGVTKYSTNSPIALCSGIRILKSNTEGVDLDFQNFSFSLNNELEEILSMASCSGVKLGAIGDRRPSFSFNPLLVTSDDWGAYADFKEGKIIEGFAITFDKGAFNRFAIVFDKIQIQSISNADQNKKTTFEFECDVISQVDDQEFAIVYY